MNNRANTERGNGGIPIDENYRYGNDRDPKSDDQMQNTLKRKTSGRILDATQRIDGNSSCDG